MPSLGVIIATGDGEQLFGGFFPIEEVAMIITVPGGTDYRSLTQPKRVMHVGWVALGHNFAGGPSSPANPSTVTAGKYVEWENEWFRPPAPGFFYERMFWHIDPGITVTLEASYP